MSFQIMCVQTEQEEEDDGSGDSDKENEEETEVDEEPEHSWKVIVTAEEGIKCQDQRQYVYL